jgi:hypothetical protein
MSVPLTQRAHDRIRESAGHSFKSALSHTMVHDTRDDPFTATRGLYLRLFQVRPFLTSSTNAFPLTYSAKGICWFGGRCKPLQVRSRVTNLPAVGWRLCSSRCCSPVCLLGAKTEMHIRAFLSVSGAGYSCRCPYWAAMPPNSPIVFSSVGRLLSECSR